MTASRDPAFSTISELAPQLESGALSPIALTQKMLDRIACFDPDLHSYTRVMAEPALDQAETAERELQSGHYKGPLHGVPVAVKDLFYTDNTPTACGSTLLKDWIPDYTADAVLRLQQAGAIILGKLAMTEFATAGYHPAHTPPKNPWHPGHVPGVSSSGSGVAVAAGLCYGALGTDTGGSIRMPSAACGIAGLKPTYGRINRHGVFPLSNTLDHVGPMARSVEDLGILLDLLSGFDRRDPGSVPAPSNRASLGEFRGLRIGVDPRYCGEDVDPDITAALQQVADTLQALGFEIKGVDLSFVHKICQYWKPLLSVEANNVQQNRAFGSTHAYGPVFAEILAFGRGVSATQIVEAFEEQQKLKHNLALLFKDVDMLLCPTEPFTAPSWEQFPPQLITPLDALSWVLRFAAPYNFSGNPALAFPCGFNSTGLPLSAQLIGPQWADELLIAVGSVYQQNTDWHKQIPTMENTT